MKTTVLFFILMVSAFFAINVVNAQCTISNNTITAPSPGTGCNPWDPGIIVGSTPTIGGAGCTLSSYQWQQSTGSWVDIATGGTSKDYDPPSLSVTTQYRRGVKSTDGVTIFPAEYSNVVTITVTNNVTASITITANPSGPVCAGTSVTFTAVPVNGGSSPTYQWYVNNNPVGPNATVYSYIPGNGDNVKCTLTSSLTCVTPNPATSNTIIISVTPTVTPGITISANPTGAVCAGTSVAFSSSINNGGPSPAYQWKVNGNNVGTNSTYSYIPVNGDIVTCVLTSSLTCATPNPVTSNSINMVVTANAPVSVTISASPSGQVCAGTSVTYTAVAVNGGSSPSYQWKVNGINNGPNAATFIYTPNNGEVIQCVVSSSLTCVSGNPATSNAITMVVNPNLVVSVSITANPVGSVCQGTSVTFTAAPTNGGTAPTYQWNVNGSNVGAGGTTYSYVPVNNDVVKCIMTSNATCISGSPTATSNLITMTVTGSVVVSVSIAASPSGAVCQGTSVTFTATPSNGGTAPSYQWVVNGGNVGTNSPTYSYIPLNNDAVKCIMTSNSLCISGSATATSNTINMTVNPSLTVGVSISVNPSNTVCEGTSVTFTASPVNPGTSPSYQWYKNSQSVGFNQSTYTCVPNNNDQVYVVMTSSITSCTSNNPATSNTITMIVNPNVVAGVVITANPSVSVCVGTSVVFTATAVYGGTSPLYQWSVNGTNVGTNNKIYTYTPNNNDKVKCVMTSNASCITGNPASDEVTMIVSDNLPVSITISPNSNPSCINQPVTFTATPINGGSNPVYQWKVNGNIQGTNSNSYTYTPTNNQNVTCKLTSNLSCADPTTNPATSPPITMQVVQDLPVSVSITASEEIICTGKNVIFTASPVNPGSNPNYQWKINGVVVATDTIKYQTSELKNLDQVSCVLTSSLICALAGTNPATSNTISMTVNNSIQVAVSISCDNNPACQGTPVKFTASGNTGVGFNYQWKKNGTDIPGEINTTYTSSNLSNGDHLTCILTSNSECAVGSPATSNSITMGIDPPTVTGTLYLKNVTPCQNLKDTIFLNGIHSPIKRWERNANNAGWFTFQQGFIGDQLPILNSETGNFLYRAIVQSGIHCDSAINGPIAVQVTAANPKTLVEKAPAVHKSRGDLFLLCTTCDPAIDTLDYNYEWGIEQVGLNDSMQNAYKNKPFCLFNQRDTVNKKYFLDVTKLNSEKSGCDRNYYTFPPAGLKFEESSIFSYPNPNSGIFDVVLSSAYIGHCDIIVKNLLGKTVKNMALEKSYPNQNVGIKIDFPEKGIYLIEVIFGNGEGLITKILVY
jgi:hypothetical protein